MLRSHIVVAVLAAGGLLSGCGDSGPSPQTDRTWTTASGSRRVERIEECLIEVGVQFAVTPRDIGFLARESKRGNVILRGQEFEARDNVVVRVFVARDGGAANWTLWSSQPPPGSRSPRQILEDFPRLSRRAEETHSYVAVKTHPKPSFRHEVARCVDVDGGRSGG